MRITLVVPGLLALPPAELAQVNALRRVAAVATVHSFPGLDEAILADLGCDAQPAPLAASGAGIDVGRAWVARADPVAMTVGHDDVRLAGCVLDLDDTERRQLVDLLATHFAADGLAFAAPRADAWFVSIATPQQVTTTAAEAVGDRALRALLPSGPDAARWRRWLTEAQMLLHDHPLARRDGLPVHGVWFSGGGVLPGPEGIAAFEARAPGGRHGDVLRGLARVARCTAGHPVASLPEAVAASSHDRLAIALPPVDSVAELARIARDFLLPAIDASHFSLIADGNGTAARWSLQRPSWLARLSRRQAAFVVPETIDRA